MIRVRRIPTERGGRPRSERLAGPAGRGGTSGGSAPPHSSLSRGSGGHTCAHTADTPCNASLSLAAAPERERDIEIDWSLVDLSQFYNSFSPLLAEPQTLEPTCSRQYPQRRRRGAAAWGSMASWSSLAPRGP